jgi:hypothetical protein
MAMPPIPELNLNSSAESETGDLFNRKNTNFNFGAPVINKTDYKTMALVVFAAGVAFLAYKKLVK